MTATTNVKPADQTRAAEVRMIVRRARLAALLAAALMVMSGPARASAIHTVCGSGCEFSTIGAAITASSPGDGIEVMPGTYSEQVDVTKKLSISGPTSGPRPVIEWSQAGDTTVTIEAAGTAHDVVAQPGSDSGCGTGCAAGRVTIGYSNFRTADGVPDTTIGHNQSADPLLVNPAVGAGQDFHIASANSPLIGAGTPDPSNGPSDSDGVAHPDPPAIGAYEYPEPPAAPSGTLPPAAGTGMAGPGGGSVTTGVGGVRRKPTISQLGETHAVFAVALVSTPLRGRTVAASSRRGTTFRFGLDQPATVTIVITTRAKCRRTIRRTAGDPRCARTVARLTRSAHVGVNNLPFSGRIGGRPLNTGDYRAIFAATSAGGSSDPKTLHFRIVGR